MLRRLILRDFVIVTSLDIDLSSGFTALTGETGAGKSILIDALPWVAAAMRAWCVKAPPAQTSLPNLNPPPLCWPL